MKRIAVLVAALGAVLMIGMPAVAASKSTTDSKRVVLASSKTFEGTYIRAASSVTLDGTVNGDVIVAANSVAINGTVNGSVYVIASDFTHRGKVMGNIHVLASRVHLEGSASSVYSGSSSLVSTKDMNLSGTLIAAGSTLDLSGKIARPGYLAGSTIAFNAASGGSLFTASSELRLGPDAVVKGDLSYSEQAQLSIDNDKNISGSIKKIAAPRPQHNAWLGTLIGSLIGVAMSFVLGLVLLRLTPTSISATSHYVGRYPARSLLVGLGFVVLMPLAIVAGFFSLVGIPLAVLGLLAYIAVFVVADVFVALWLGRRISRQQSTAYGAEASALLIGLLALAFLRAIPVLGAFVAIAAFLFGSGALVARSWQRIRHVGRLQAKG